MIHELQLLFHAEIKSLEEFFVLEKMIIFLDG